MLSKFWEIENVPTVRDTAERSECEKHFDETYTRNAEGRFVLKLPFKGNHSEMGDTRKRALNCLIRAERTESTNVRQGYVNFMNEYLMLEHMSEVSTTELNGVTVNYLPHHAVIKETSTSTRIRVVFNASAKSDNGKGLSLNDCLMIGPVLQPELFDVLIRFRSYAVAFTCDIKQMYCQILIETTSVFYEVM